MSLGAQTSSAQIYSSSHKIRKLSVSGTEARQRFFLHCQGYCYAINQGAKRAFLRRDFSYHAATSGIHS